MSAIQAVQKFKSVIRVEISASTHHALKANVCKWLCFDGTTWRAGDRSTATWFNCENELEADYVVEAMTGLTTAQIKAT